MTSPLAYGIDFGTTNSLISVASAVGVDVIPVEGATVMPSVTYLHRIGRHAAGGDGLRDYLVTGSAITRCGGGCDRVSYMNGAPETGCLSHRAGGFCNDSRLIAALKSFLTGKRSATHSWGTDFEYSEVVAVVLRRLKHEADLASGADVRRVVVGHPVAYPGAEGDGFSEKQRRALSRMEEAALAAGFEQVVMYPEPAAAVLGEEAVGTVVAVDFGGGTFDVAVLDMKLESGEVLALQGVAVGGEDFDAALFEHKIAEQVGVPPSASQELREGLRNLSGAMFAIRSKELRAELDRRAPNSPISKILYGGYAYDFYAAIEQAKVALSGASEASVDFHRPGIDVSVRIERSEFEALIAPDLDLTFDQIERALDDAGVKTNEVDLVVRTGGSSAIPAFVDGLASIFDPGRIERREAFSTIVRGLGIHAQEVWQ